MLANRVSWFDCAACNRKSSESISSFTIKNLINTSNKNAVFSPTVSRRQIEETSLVFEMQHLFLNGSPGTHFSAVLSFTHSVLIGVFEVLKVMHELGVELNAETYTDYVFKNFADIETACAQMKVSLHLEFIKKITGWCVSLCVFCERFRYLYCSKWTCVIKPVQYIEITSEVVIALFAMLFSLFQS